MPGSEPRSQSGCDPCAAIHAADPGRPFVVAQLGQSLDGRIATPTGESRWINKDAALDHVHRVRAAVDAVVVGVGTIAADDPWLNVRRVPGRHPARVVIDPTGRIPAGANCLRRDDGARRLVVTTLPHGDLAHLCTDEGIEIVHVPAVGRRIDPNAIVAALFSLGLRRLLIEGGASTVSAFIDADAIDRLHVLVAPMILGSGKTGIELRPISRLVEAHRPHTRVHVLSDGDVLFDCDLRRPMPM